MPFLVHTLLVAPTLPGAWVTCKRGRCSPAVAGAFAALTVAIGLVIIMLVFRWYEVRIPAYGEAAKSSNPREQHEVVLVAFPPCGALASSTSHACAKVEAYLRFAGIPFKKENGSPDQAPRKAVRTTGPFSPRGATGWDSPAIHSFSAVGWNLAISSNTSQSVSLSLSE